MNFDWLAWSNPVAIWWVFLVAVSTTNIVLCTALYRLSHMRAVQSRPRYLEAMLLLCAVYVSGCAFRSILPRADVQRICLFDTWLSSVLIGRSVATCAELCFAAQWAIMLRQVARLTKSDTAMIVSAMIVPLIVLAECCSWYAVITTSYLGNTAENSIWAMTFLLIALALVRQLKEFGGLARLAIAVSIAGVGFYVAFLLAVDIPMYFGRWQADLAAGKPLLGLAAGFDDVRTHWIVTRDYAFWKDEIPWMSLYFSAAVWSSLTLCGLNLVIGRLPEYRISSKKLGPDSGMELAR